MWHCLSSPLQPRPSLPSPAPASALAGRRGGLGQGQAGGGGEEGQAEEGGAPAGGDCQEEAGEGTE